MPEKSTVLSFTDLIYRIGGNTLIDRATFKVQEGEFVYLVGKTGSGKSSLLRFIYADLVPQAGSVKLREEEVVGMERKSIPDLRRKLGIVFQDFQLLPDRSVEDNLLFAMKATGWKDRESMVRRASALLEELDLRGKGAQYPHQLSGGEQQRVGIARALVNDPVLLIADEPTGNLDPVATHTVMKALKAVSLRGTSILMATHEYSILRDYPGRVLWLKDSAVQEFATSDLFLSAFEDRPA